MTNHFHLLIYIPTTSEGLNFIANQNQQILIRKIGTLLSSYSQAINKQEGKSGSIFQQKTKSKILNSNNYSTTCFHYIHQNPFRPNLVSKIEDWPYSSFQDYLEGESNICNIAMARELLEIPVMKDQFYHESYLVLDHDLIKNVY